MHRECVAERAILSVMGKVGAEATARVTAGRRGGTWLVCSDLHAAPELDLIFVLSFFFFLCPALKVHSDWLV